MSALTKMNDIGAGCSWLAGLQAECARYAAVGRVVGRFYVSGSTFRSH